MKASKTKAIVDALLLWFATNARDLPWRRTHDPYAVWVAEIMLHRTFLIVVLTKYGSGISLGNIIFK